MRLLPAAIALALALSGAGADAATFQSSHAFVVLAANILTPLNRALVPMCVSGDGAHRRYKYTSAANDTCVVGDGVGTGYYYLPGGGYAGTIKRFPRGTTEQ